MFVSGRDCSIVIRTRFREAALPYTEETIREAVSLLTEEATIEGDGFCRVIRKSAGVTGCVVTPLTMGTVPLLLALALGEAGRSEFVSETRNLYRHTLNLMPMEGGPRFDLIQGHGTERRLYEGCRVKDFELRIGREAAVRLRIDIHGDNSAVSYPYLAPLVVNDAERFKEDGVSYWINGMEYRNIYGLTISAKKTGGTKTEVRIHRILEKEELPSLIESMEITARLFRDKYEYRHYGMFRLTLSRLIFMADETSINTGGEVIGPLRYYVTGNITAEIFTSGEDIIL
jgi:hypothetical protein